MNAATSIDPRILTAILEALEIAGKPCTAGEIRTMRMRGVKMPSSAVFSEALKHLARTRKIVVKDGPMPGNRWATTKWCSLPSGDKAKKGGRS